MPFYIGDWRKATDVQALPLEAKAVWFEMLLYMWESTERGFLTVNRKPIPESALARMLGLHEDLLKQNLKLCLDFGVASIRESDGAIYCRRMVRDQEIREKRQKAGSLGGKKSFASRFAQANTQANADIENDIDIENESKERNINVGRRALGEFGNVSLTDRELELFISRATSRSLAEDAIKRLDAWLENHPASKNQKHYPVLLTWPLDEAKKNAVKSQTSPQNDESKIRHIEKYGD